MPTLLLVGQPKTCYASNDPHMSKYVTQKKKKKIKKNNERQPVRVTSKDYVDKNK